MADRPCLPFQSMWNVSRRPGADLSVLTAPPTGPARRRRHCARGPRSPCTGHLAQGELLTLPVRALWARRVRRFRSSPVARTPSLSRSRGAVAPPDGEFVALPARVGLPVPLADRWRRRRRPVEDRAYLKRGGVGAKSVEEQSPRRVERLPNAYKDENATGRRDAAPGRHWKE